MPLPLLIALPLLALGTLIVAVNVYTSFLRYPLHRLRGGTRDDFRFVSGVPLVGSLLLCLAAACLGPWPALAWTALALCLLDTSGPHFLAAFLLYTLLFRRQPKRGA